MKRKKTFLQSNNFCLELQIFIHKFIVSLAQTVGMCAVLVLTCSQAESELQMDWLPGEHPVCVWPHPRDQARLVVTGQPHRVRRLPNPHLFLSRT